MLIKKLIVFAILWVPLLTVHSETNKIPLEVFKDDQQHSLVFLHEMTFHKENQENLLVPGPYIDFTKFSADYDQKMLFEVTPDDYYFEKYLSAGVFQALGGSGKSLGSAFLIGKNLVLTNVHVADTTHSELACKKFGVFLNDAKASFVPCKKVHYCHPEEDFCLIETQNFKGKSLDNYAKILSLQTSLPLTSEETIVYSVSNAKGKGIQGSKGKGFTLNKSDNPNHAVYSHGAPMFQGSSGSPVFDSMGSIIGITFAEMGSFTIEKPDQEPVTITVTDVSPFAENYAVSSEFIWQSLKDNLPQNILNKISTDELLDFGQLASYQMTWEDFDNEFTREALNDLTVKCFKIPKKPTPNEQGMMRFYQNHFVHTVSENSRCMESVNWSNDRLAKTQQTLLVARTLNNRYKALGEELMNLFMASYEIEKIKASLEDKENPSFVEKHIAWYENSTLPETFGQWGFTQEHAQTITQKFLFFMPITLEDSK
ncbi:MAG: S1 family peptidase [Bacteriovoracia bacterium]